jgi:hypothetical protein
MTQIAKMEHDAILFFLHFLKILKIPITHKIGE